MRNIKSPILKIKNQILFCLLILCVYSENAKAEKIFYKKLTNEIEYQYIVKNNLQIHIIKADIYNVLNNLKVGLAWDKIGKLEKLGSLAKRYKALGAINGSFYNKSSSSPFPIGYIITNGELVYKSDINRSCFGITSFKDLIFGYFKPYIRITLIENNKSFLLDGVNRPRPKNGAVIYSKYYGKKTGTSKIGGQEMILKKEVDNGNYFVADIVDGDAEIPEDGYVVSATGKKLKIFDWIYIGAKVSIELEVPPEWENVTELITGGPMLVKNGKVFVTADKEGFYGYMKGKNPRTAVGETIDGKLVFVVVDGRSKESIGMTYYELARFLISIGVYNAIGLDSGGSSTMYLLNQIVNKPSDGQQRSIGNGLLLFTEKATAN